MSPPKVASSLTPLELRKLYLARGHQVDGLDVRRLPAVELVHLELVLEVGDRAQALDDRLRPALAREVDDEDAERLDRDVAEVARSRRSTNADPLLGA